MQSQHPLSVSIIVCSYNGERSIAECLKSLVVQTYLGTMQIIVVDDGSTDRTAAIARQYTQRVISHKANLGVAHARNTGLQAARGQLIAYVDDDCTIGPQWLRELVSVFVDPDVVAAGGRIVARKTQYLAERFMQAIGYGNPAPYRAASNGHAPQRFVGYVQSMFKPIAVATVPQEAQAVYTANVAYRAAALKAIGGFDALLRSDEDVDVSCRLRAVGGKLVFVPKAVARHRHHERLWHIVRQVFYRAANTYHYYRKEHKMLPLFPLPFLYLAMVGASLLANPWIALAVAVFGPLLLYNWWIARVIETRRLECLIYSYIQLLVEIATLMGLLRGALQGDHKYATGQYALRSIKDKKIA